MKIAVTGGSGFVGRYVVEHLRKEGHEVTPIDIAAKDDGIMVDAVVRHQVKAAMTEVKPNVVIHLAALAGSTGKGGGIESSKYPYEYFNVNFNGTLNVFETCRELGINKVLCMSSFSPYGVAKCPISEETPFLPNNPYGASKACAEEVVKSYSAYGIKTVIFRPPLICGEGQKEMNALREFVYSALHDDPLIIFGDGKHVREFLHPHDVGRAFSAGVDYISKMGKPFDIFVLGNKPISMRDLAEMVIIRVGKGSVGFKPTTKQVFDQFTDHRKAMDLLGWRPTIDVGEIIERVVNETRPVNYVPLQD